MDEKLIYDVGANNGDDTAFYLAQGYRVIAIEASPKMAAGLKTRFADEIDRGGVVLLNVGIADRQGQMQFWVCEDNPDWSSFHREIASRNNSRHHSEIVDVVPFRQVLAERGTPFYCKIDIEGNDRLCLAGLSDREHPKYISIEMSHHDGDRDLTLLRELGYDKFKIISQVTRTQPLHLLSMANFWLSGRAREFLMQSDRKWRGVSSKAGWHFPFGSSGPFGEDTPGRWNSYEATLRSWRRLHDLDARHKAGGLGDWYDIHAAA